MSINRSLEELKFDIRLIDWNIKHGKLKPEEVKKHLDALPDSSANSEVLTLDENHIAPSASSQNSVEH